jgi:hypothetical protein
MMSGSVAASILSCGKNTGSMPEVGQDWNLVPQQFFIGLNQFLHN